MDSTVIRNVYIEYLDNLNFKIRHISTLNSTEKQLLQELIFNESKKAINFDKQMENVKKMVKTWEETREI